MSLAEVIANRYRRHVGQAQRPREGALSEHECIYCGLRWFRKANGDQGGIHIWIDDGQTITHAGRPASYRLGPCLARGTTEIPELK